MRLTLNIWRQKSATEPGKMVKYDVPDVNEHMSFLEMLDVLNQRLITQGEDPVVFEHDCREGICGCCGFMIDGVPHGPQRGTTVCQLHMRHFKDGQELYLEPFRAALPAAIFTAPPVMPAASDGSGRDRKQLRAAADQYRDDLLVVMREGGRLAAKSGEREDNGDIILHDAAYSGCAIEDIEGCAKKPSWEITAVRVHYDDKQKRVRYKGAVLHVFGVPLLPLPGLAHTSDFRAVSGLLIPGWAMDGGYPALKARLRKELRTNSYDADSGTLGVSDDRAIAISNVAAHYESVFSNDPATAKLRETYAMRDGTVDTPEHRRQLSAFFFWSAWATVTTRPGAAMSYTSNGPYDPVVGNTPTPSAFLWTVFSVLFMIAGIGALAMRRAGSVSEWNFAGLNEVSSGYRTALGACTPPTNRVFQAGEPLMLDFHSMFKLALGDYSHNYLIGPASKTLRRHADNFVDLVDTVLKAYRAGRTPSDMASVMSARAEALGCADYIYPGCEHGIGLFGDEWRIGARNDGPFPYWTDPDHVYRKDEMLICAMQYAAPADSVGFRYENPIIIGEGGCEWLSKFPLVIEEIA